MAFTSQVIQWLTHQHQHMDIVAHLSWIELVAALRCEGIAFPVRVATNRGEAWKDVVTHSSYAIAQPTVSSDFALLRSFFRSLSGLLQLDIGEIRGLNLSKLKIGPPQAGLTLQASFHALKMAEGAICAFTASRPVRVTNDWTRPFRFE